MTEETPEQKQARFDKELAEKLERNRKAAEESKGKVVSPGKQSAAYKRGEQLREKRQGKN